MAKKTSKKNHGKTEAVENNFLFSVVLFCFGILIFYPPFFRGLFFKVEQQWTLLFAALIFFACCLWKISRKDFRFFNDPFCYSAFALFAVYVIASFRAADMRLAVAEIVKMGIYVAVFWVAGQLVMEKDTDRRLLTILYISGVCVAAAGFLSAVGVLNIKDGFVSGRVYSTLQYPNALAIYLAALACFGFYLWLTSSGLKRLCFAAGNFILLFIFFAANSRGGFLVFAGMVVLYLLGLPKEKKLPWLGHVIYTIAAGIFCAGKVIPAATAQNYGSAWVWFLVIFGVTLMVNWFGQKYVSSFPLSFKGISTKKIIVVAVVCVLLIGTGIVIFGNGDGTTAAQAGAGPQGQSQSWYFKVIPEHIAQRIASINLETSSAQDRMYWTLQALDIVKKSPVIGLGGGAWEAYYRAVQDYPYNSTQVHNQFLQVWAEVGTVGFIIYLSLWALFVVISIKNYMAASDSKERTLDLSLFVAAVGLGVHSFIDFDLALSAVSIVLWSSFGIAWGRSLKRQEYYQKDLKKVKGQKKAFVIGTSFLSLCFFILSGSLLVSNAYGKEGVAYIQAGNLEMAEGSFLSASRFDPFASELKATLASIKNVQKDEAAAVEYMNEAIAKSPYNYNLFSGLSSTYLNYGKVDKAVDAGKKAVNCAPWLVPAYQSLTEAYVQGGLKCLGQKDIKGAKKYFTECAGLPEALKEKAEKIPEKAQQIWVGREAFFNLNPAIKMNIGISYLYLEQFGESEENLMAAYNDEQLKPRASFWLAVLYEKMGKTADARKYLGEAQADMTQNFESFVALTAVPKPK